MNKEFVKDVLGIFNDCVSHESCLDCPNCYCDWIRGDKCFPRSISHIPTDLCELASRIINDTIDLQHRCFEWISVEDRLPYKDSVYLVVTGINFKYVTTRCFTHDLDGSISNDFCEPEHHKRPGWYVDHYIDEELLGRFREDKHVTHWMPIPNLPKEE